jgi:hypothetical protein
LQAADLDPELVASFREAHLTRAFGEHAQNDSRSRRARVEPHKAHLDQHVSAGDDARVFTDPHGWPLHKDVLYKAWRPARPAVGLEHATIYDLRHAGATLGA